MPAGNPLMLSPMGAAKPPVRATCTNSAANRDVQVL
jgi:hypothetical protein